MQTLNAPDDSIDLNLLGLWRIVAARWALIVAVALSIIIIAVAASFLIKPTYRADVLLAGVSRDGSGSPLAGLFSRYSGLASLAGVDLGNAEMNSVDETIEVMRSRAFTKLFVNKHDLMPVLFADEWARAERTKHQGDSEQGVTAEKPLPTMWDAFERFDSVRKISKDTKTGFFKVSIEWHDPVVAATWANTLVALLNEHLRQRAIEEANRSITFLQEQLDLTAVLERRQMLVGLMEVETRKIVLAKARDEYAVRVLDKAVVPEERVKPRRSVIGAAAALAGLFAGMLVAFMLEYRRRARGS